MIDSILLNRILLTLFLVANLVVGLWAMRPIKTMDDYALANRSLGGGVMIATLIATLFEVKSIELSILCSKGIINLLKPFIFSFMALLMGVFIFPKLLVFKKERTVSDIMNTFYGKEARIYTLLIMSLFSIGVVMAQLVALGGMSDMLGMKSYPQFFIIIIGTCIIIYSLLGGIYAVAKTDVLQFLVIVIGIVVFFVLSTYENGVWGIIKTAERLKPKYLTFLKEMICLGVFLAIFHYMGYQLYLFLHLLYNVY